MPSLTDSWDSQYSYQDTTSVPAADTGKTNDQIEKENLERNTKAAIKKSRQIKQQQKQLRLRVVPRKTGKPGIQQH